MCTHDIHMSCTSSTRVYTAEKLHLCYGSGEPRPTKFSYHGTANQLQCTRYLGIDYRTHCSLQLYSTHSLMACVMVMHTSCSCSWELSLLRSLPFKNQDTGNVHPNMKPCCIENIYTSIFLYLTQILFTTKL